jgi:putative tryptophan/tyrosine transport system substrate-binding protein
MRRREFLRYLSAAVASPATSRAQISRKGSRVGILFGTDPRAAAPYEASFLAGMQEHGYMPHRDFELLARYADGHVGRLPALARELAAAEPVVIVTGATVTTTAVMEADPSIPIVCSALFDPVGRRLARTDARPGGTVTGLHWSIEGLPGKQLEIILELVPRARRVGHLIQTAAPALHNEMVAAAERIGVSIVPVDVRVPDQLETAFTELARKQVEAFMVLGQPIFISEHKRILSLAAENRLPGLFGWREFVEAGGLISYAVNLRHSYRRSAAYVGKILRGERPGDLPIELPTVELVINLKAARDLGLTIPPTLLARADEVIE